MRSRVRPDHHAISAAGYLINRYVCNSMLANLRVCVSGRASLTNLCSANDTASLPNVSLIDPLDSCRFSQVACSGK